MLLHVTLYLAILATVIWSRHLSYTFRAGVVVTLPLLLAIAWLVSWGMAAFILPALFCFCIFSTILFGLRAGILSSIFSVAVIGIMGGCILIGILDFDFNAQAYLNSPAIWLAAIISMTLFTGTVVVALGTLNRQIEELACTLERQNEDLLRKNVMLETEIEERIHAEEEARLLEDKLHSARKMESIGELAGGVAHDLNNILGSIVGYPDLLLHKLPEHSPLQDTILKIKKSGIKAAAIANDLLTLARSGAGKFEVIDLNSVILEYISSPEFGQLKSLHKDTNVDILPVKEPLPVCGSFFHLFKVMMNLMANAAEAMPDGGQIVVSTEKRTVDLHGGGDGKIQDGDYAVLCISDTGIGIPPEDRERIFEPFYTRKSMGMSGTGLGMPVVLGSVKDHNGHIIVESEQGKGTKFSVYLPLAKEQATPRKLLYYPKAHTGRGESILIIDDVEEQREIATGILQEMGYSVHSVRSGEEAIEYLRAVSVDLLILDMLMEPGMDGLETYKKVLEIHPGQKVILTTGFSETSRVKEAQNLGAGGCLRKPYLLDQIGYAVRTELDRNQRLRSEGSCSWN